MPRTTRAAVALAALLLAAACAGTPAGTTTAPPGSATQPPSGTTPPAVPTGTATAPPVGGNECAAFPTIDPSNPTAFPSFAPDPALEARFPAQIDGEPVRDLESFSWAALVCLAGQTAIDRVRGTVEFDLLALTMATAEATVDGEDVTLVAFRKSGGSGQEIVNVLAQLVAAAGDQSDIEAINPGTAGGKSVIVISHDDGTSSYGYVSGDTLFTAENITQSQADKIFSALP